MSRPRLSTPRDGILQFGTSGRYRQDRTEHSLARIPAAESVVVVTLVPGVPHEALFDVVATTLRVASRGPTRYLLDEPREPADALARRLAREPWCAAAEAFDAVGPGWPAAAGSLAGRRLSVPLVVSDPALGLLRYWLWPR